jgi:hypothetical protein
VLAFVAAVLTGACGLLLVSILVKGTHPFI